MTEAVAALAGTPAPAQKFAADALLEVRSLSCVRDDRTLFENLDFSLGSGQMLLLEGRNGCGKTSLLRILCGIRLQDDGEILWGGQNSEKLGPAFHEHIVYVGHHDGMKRDLTPRENLRFARSLGRPSSMGIDDALDRMNLYGFEDVITRGLSAGQQRRLALSRLLVTDAELWVLDEPFTSLDVRGIDLFESIMGEHIDNGGMIVMTSHHSLTHDYPRVERINLSERGDKVS